MNKPIESCYIVGEEKIFGLLRGSCPWLVLVTNTNHDHEHAT